MESSPRSTPNTPFPKELFTLALVVILLWGAWVAQAFLIPVSLAALLAFLMAPVVRIIVRFKAPEWLAITLTAVLLLLPVILVTVMVAKQLQALVQDFPAIMASAQKSADSLAQTSWGQKLHLSQQLSMTSITERVTNGAGESVQFIMHGLRTVLEAGTQLVLVFLFSILMLASKDHLFRSAKQILSQFEGIEAGRLLEAVTQLIEKFLLTKMIVIVIVSALTFGVLQILGLKYAFLLGVMTGVLTLLPEVGFVIGLVPVAIVAAATGHSVASHIAILSSVVVLHLIEANWLTPQLVGRKLNLNVLSTFIGLFGGGLLWGVWGMLLSVPILGVMRIVLSASPSLQPWAELLAEREDKQLARQIRSRVSFPARFIRRSPLEADST